MTDAETKWKAIVWAKLDAVALGAKTVTAAQKNLHDAEMAEGKVTLAKNAVLTAKQQASAAAKNKALSKPAQTAATAILDALKKAEERLDEVSVDDFKKVVKEQEEAEAKSAIIKVAKIRVVSARQEVATGADATWDRKVLKVTGLVWKVGKSDDYKGKTLTVYGETEGNIHYEGIGKVFQNDMKIESASGSTATFKS